MAEIVMSRICREHHKDMEILAFLGEYVLKMRKDIGYKGLDLLMRYC
jgi:hypothetical protein